MGGTPILFLKLSPLIVNGVNRFGSDTDIDLNLQI